MSLVPYRPSPPAIRGRARAPQVLPGGRMTHPAGSARGGGWRELVVAIVEVRRRRRLDAARWQEAITAGRHLRSVPAIEQHSS